MIKRQLHFALWAEDIGQYLHTGYNTPTIKKIDMALRSYISVDETEEEKYNQLSLLQILQMTGLTLDYSITDFTFLDDHSEQTLNCRAGIKVPVSFIS
jgi:hypothetical protein